MGLRKRFVRLKRLICILMDGNLKRFVFYVNVLLSNNDLYKIVRNNKREEGFNIITYENN